MGEFYRKTITIIKSCVWWGCRKCILFNISITITESCALEAGKFFRKNTATESCAWWGGRKCILFRISATTSEPCALEMRDFSRKNNCNHGILRAERKSKMHFVSDVKDRQRILHREVVEKCIAFRISITVTKYVAVVGIVVAREESQSASCVATSQLCRHSSQALSPYNRTCDVSCFEVSIRNVDIAIWIRFDHTSISFSISNVILLFYTFLKVTIFTKISTTSL